MTHYILITVAVAVLLHASSTPILGQPNQPRGGQVLLRKTLAEGSEIVVIQTALVDAARLHGIAPERMLGNLPLQGVVALHAEVRIGDESVLPLWTETFAIGEGFDPSVSVHAIEVAPAEVDLSLFGGMHTISVAEIVVAFSFGDWVMLHLQRLPSAPVDQHTGRIKMFRTSDWNALALPEEFAADELRIVLERDDEGLWTVQFGHTVKDVEQRTLFRQTKGKWDFDLVRRDKSRRNP